MIVLQRLRTRKIINAGLGEASLILIIIFFGSVLLSQPGQTDFSAWLQIIVTAIFSLIGIFVLLKPFEKGDKFYVAVWSSLILCVAMLAFYLFLRFSPPSSIHANRVLQSLGIYFLVVAGIVTLQLVVLLFLVEFGPKDRTRTNDNTA